MPSELQEMLLLNLERALEIPNGLAGAAMTGACIPEGLIL